VVLSVFFFWYPWNSALSLVHSGDSTLCLLITHAIFKFLALRPPVDITLSYTCFLSRPLLPPGSSPLVNAIMSIFEGICTRPPSNPPPLPPTFFPLSFYPWRSFPSLDPSSVLLSCFFVYGRSCLETLSSAHPNVPSLGRNLSVFPLGKLDFIFDADGESPSYFLLQLSPSLDWPDEGYCCAPPLIDVPFSFLHRLTSCQTSISIRVSSYPCHDPTGPDRKGWSDFSPKSFFSFFWSLSSPPFPPAFRRASVLPTNLVVTSR